MSSEEAGGGSQSEAQWSQPRPTRLTALDVLRGWSVLLMLLVNNFGLRYNPPSQLRHAGWVGLHLADMAFPWFLFCVGVAIPFSVASARRKQLPRREYYLRILKRVAILLVLGAVLDSASEKRIILFSVGILQTIAISYLVSILIYPLALRWRLLLAAAGLIAHWAVIKLLPISCGTGTFEERCNAILYLNQVYLAKAGLWGLPRIVPTSALVLLGTAIGDIVRRKDVGATRKTLELAAAGIIFLVMGFLWNLNLAFNKPVWTPSYVLFSVGTGSLLLVVLYQLIDVRNWKAWAFPFVVFGTNAILAYVLPILSRAAVLNPLHISTGGWLRVSLFILFWWVVLWWLYRKQIFLRA